MTSSTYFKIKAAPQTGWFTNNTSRLFLVVASLVLNLKIWHITLSGISKCFDSCHQQVPQLRTILNGGAIPDTKVTIISIAQPHTITSEHSIVSPNVNAEISTLLYGLE